MIDEERIARAVQEILLAVGEDTAREGIRRTPQRVAAMYAELFSGIGQDPRPLLSGSYDEDADQLITVRDIPFSSICEHHLLPFFGAAHVGYLPAGRVAGISKLARAIECLSRRPQMQERLTNQAASLIADTLEPHGVAIVLEAEHLCMTIRGVRAPGSRVITTAWRGTFRDDETSRREFLTLTGVGASA